MIFRVIRLIRMDILPCLRPEGLASPFLLGATLTPGIELILNAVGLEAGAF